jgi:hypothetical protein
VRGAAAGSTGRLAAMRLVACAPEQEPHVPQSRKLLGSGASLAGLVGEILRPQATDGDKKYPR